MLKNEIISIIRSQNTKVNNTIPRTINIAENPLVKVITGIRRCGKSTLMKQLLRKGDTFVNFEDPRLNSFQTEDFVKILDMSKRFFFDEIQNIPQWEKAVRYFRDQEKIVFVTGSNADLLNKELGTKLTGRYISYELYPFSESEYKRYTKRDSYITEGGFPEYLKNRDDTILINLLVDILQKDVILRYDIREKNELLQLTTYLITNVTKDFSYHKLSKMFKLSVTTVSNFMQYLNDAYLLFTVPKFSFSLKKQLLNPKKIYGIDNGLLQANSMSFTEDKGRLLENAVFMKLRRKFDKIFYFRENSECDFLVQDRDSIPYAIQVCHSLHSENMERELNVFSELPKVRNKLIVTMNQEDEIDGIKVIPFKKFKP